MDLSDSNKHNAVAEPQIICNIVTPVGMLGYGLSEPETEKILQDILPSPIPAALILDSGSTDSGPSKLALGHMTCPRSAYVRDLRKLLQLKVKFNVPLLIGSAGGDGSDAHVDDIIDIIHEICEDEDHRSWRFQVLGLYSQIRKDVLAKRLDAGLVAGCGPVVPVLTHRDIEDTPRIVAQMGPEPFLEAMLANPGFDIIIGGRAYDPAPYIAFCAYHARKGPSISLTDFDPHQLGCFVHMGKIMECGGQCAVPKNRGAVATVYDNHTFKSRPDLLYGPGGVLDLTGSTYQQADAVAVRVQGSVFRTWKAQNVPYAVKLEGARVTGYRTLMMGSFHDPVLMRQIHSFLDYIKEEMGRQSTDIKGSWDVAWHVYGLDAQSQPVANEVFLVAEIIAATQSQATRLASTARIYCAHAPYRDQKATSGNFAMGVGGQFELETAECAEFSVYHLITLTEGEEGLAPKSLENRSAAEVKSVPGLFRMSTFWAGRGEKSELRLLNGHREQVATIPASVQATPKRQSQSVTNGRLVKPPRTLIDAAQIIRSKNAGPYELTFDVIFDNNETYSIIKRSGMLSEQIVARVFDMAIEDIVWCGFFDQALAFKATIPRRTGGNLGPSGGFMETDVHGSQQYLPLAELELSASVMQELQALEIDLSRKSTQ